MQVHLNATAIQLQTSLVRYHSLWLYPKFFSVPASLTICEIAVHGPINEIKTREKRMMQESVLFIEGNTIHM